MATEEAALRINIWPTVQNEDWIKQSWDLWDELNGKRILVNTLLSLFRVMGQENETNAKKRAFLESFMGLPMSDLMPDELREEVELFFEATADMIDPDFLPDRNESNTPD